MEYGGIFIMNFKGKKRVMQSTAVVVSLAALSLGATFGTGVNAGSSQVIGGRTAGIVHTVNNIEAGAYATADVKKAEVTIVAKAQEEPQNPEWANRLMANVNDYVCIRATADANGEIVGKLRKGDVAEFASEENGWFQITSGNASGYVSSEFAVTGDDAYNLASQVCTVYATANEGGVRVREAASVDGSILTVMAQGDKLEVAKDVLVVDGWVAVTSSKGNGYVSNELVTVDMKMGSAITIQEEQEAIAAQKAKEAAERAKAVAVQNEAIAASVDDTTLLAALIQCEAGNECYEGQVAVGAVVVNRVRSGGYPGSIHGVVYQSGQFTPARSGSVAAVAAAGPKASCMQAAAAALGGTDNTGGALSFRPARSGRGGVVIGNHVFF